MFKLRLIHVCPSGRWVPVEKVGPDDTEANIGGLVEGKEYQFRVKALNDEGESEPLQTDHATLAKNPYGKCGIYRYGHLLLTVVSARSSSNAHHVHYFLGLQMLLTSQTVSLICGNKL